MAEDRLLLRGPFEIRMTPGNIMVVAIVGCILSLSLAAHHRGESGPGLRWQNVVAL